MGLELRKLGLLQASHTGRLTVDATELCYAFAAVSIVYYTQTLPADLSSKSGNHPELVFNEVYMETVQRALLSLHSDAIGAEGIFRKIINLIVSSLLIYITDIDNQSLRDSIIPGLWKRSIVVSVSEVPNPSSVQDYRPIASFPVLSKV